MFNILSFCSVLFAVHNKYFSRNCLDIAANCCQAKLSHWILHFNQFRKDTRRKNCFLSLSVPLACSCFFNFSIFPLLNIVIKQSHTRPQCLVSLTACIRITVRNAV